jgi:hypothetical protein
MGGALAASSGWGIQKLGVEHLLRGLQLDYSTFRQEFEQLHQAWPSSRFARSGATTPTRGGKLFDASVDPTEARNGNAHLYGPRG